MEEACLKLAVVENNSLAVSHGQTAKICGRAEARLPTKSLFTIPCSLASCVARWSPAQLLQTCRAPAAIQGVLGLSSRLLVGPDSRRQPAVFTVSNPKHVTEGKKNVKSF